MIRRRLPLTFALAAALILGGLASLAPPAAAQALVRSVGPIGMTVADVDRSAAFYGTVLGFEKVFALIAVGLCDFLHLLQSLLVCVFLCHRRNMALQFS